MRGYLSPWPEILSPLPSFLYLQHIVPLSGPIWPHQVAQKIDIRRGHVNNISPARVKLPDAPTTSSCWLRSRRGRPEGQEKIQVLSIYTSCRRAANASSWAFRWTYPSLSLCSSPLLCGLYVILILGRLLLILHLLYSQYALVLLWASVALMLKSSALKRGNSVSPSAAEVREVSVEVARSQDLWLEL